MNRAEASCSQLEDHLQASLAEQIEHATAQVERATAAAAEASRAYGQARQALLDAAGRAPDVEKSLEALERAAEAGELARLQVQTRESQLRRARARMNEFRAARARTAREACFECGGGPAIARVRIESPTILPPGSPTATFWLCWTCGSEYAREAAGQLQAGQRAAQS